MRNSYVSKQEAENYFERRQKEKKRKSDIYRLSYLAFGLVVGFLLDLSLGYLFSDIPSGYRRSILVCGEMFGVLYLFGYQVIKQQ